MTKTAIEWTEETWNPVTGCTKVSQGCDHCYAERITNRFQGPGAFDTVVLHPDRLDAPLRRRKPTMWFVNSMSDLFHDDVPREFIAKVWDVMEATPWHTYQILTKRPGRMSSMLRDREATPQEVDDGCELGVMPGIAYDRVLPNVWLGTSVEDQKWANVRIPKLMQIPASVRFLSCEPLLGPIDIARSIPVAPLRPEDGLHWVIVGGESGPGARPMDPQWARGLRDQCVDSAVAFFFKQWGGRTPKAGGRELDGRTWDQMPQNLSEANDPPAVAQRGGDGSTGGPHAGSGAAHQSEASEGTE